MDKGFAYSQCGEACLAELSISDLSRTTGLAGRGRLFGAKNNYWTERQASPPCNEAKPKNSLVKWLFCVGNITENTLFVCILYYRLRIRGHK